jgi:hypothetical protein
VRWLWLKPFHATEKSWRCSATIGSTYANKHTHTHTHHNTQKNVASAYAKRCWKLCTWYGGGRVGEVAVATTEHLAFDSEFRNLRVDWQQVKTGKMKTVFWNNHATSYVSCVYNALHSYFVSSSHCQTRGKFLFADLCEVKQASNKIGKMYTEFYNDPENHFKLQVPAGMTGSVRVHSISREFHIGICLFVYSISHIGRETETGWPTSCVSTSTSRRQCR